MGTASIEHQGVITELDNTTVKVSLLNVASCSSCHAKAMCNVSEVDDKVIEVYHYGQEYKIGEKVKLSYNKSMGFKALFIGYLMPFLTILATLIISLAITGNEPLSGLLALGVLVPYYSILALFKNNLKKTFSFTLVR